MKSAGVKTSPSDDGQPSYFSSEITRTQCIILPVTLRVAKIKESNKIKESKHEQESRMILRLLAVIALLDAQPLTTSPRANARLEVVLAVCNEPAERIDALQAFASRLRAATQHAHSREWTVSMRMYCKCGVHAWCDERLPNVGREGHTFLEHMVRHYDQLADVTLFMNPGTGDRSVSASKVRIADRVMSDTLHALAHDKLTESFYADGEARAVFAPVASVGAARNWSLARQTCWTDAATLCSPQAVAAASKQCPVHLILPCERHCGCGDPGVCKWSGSTLANNVTLPASLASARTERRTARRKMAALLPAHPSASRTMAVLAAAQPASFSQWACDWLAVSLKTFKRCGWARTATFAVGSARVRSHPSSVFKETAQELARVGVTAGVSGHYMERLWRSLFVCSGGDNK